MERCDDWFKLTKENDNVRVLAIDLTTEPCRNKFQHKYFIKLERHVPGNVNMTLFFPTHPVEKKRRLCIVGWKHSTLQKEINARLAESRKDGISLGVSSRGTIYKFEGIQGNVYFVWCNRINQHSRNAQLRPIHEHLPMLIEMDGFGVYRSIFAFPEKDDINDLPLSCIPVKDTKVYEPIDEALFCLESYAAQEIQPYVRTLSESAVDEITKQEVSDAVLLSIDHEAIPFGSDEDE